MMNNEERIKAGNVENIQAAIQLAQAMMGGNPFIPFQNMDPGKDGYDEEKQLECLGVPPHCIERNETGFRLFVNLIPPNSVYGQLERPAVLPGKCPIEIDSKRDEHCQELVERLWSGLASFKVQGEIPKRKEDKLEILIWVGSKQSEDIQAVGQLTFCFFDGKQLFQCSFGNPIEKRLDEAKIQLLGCRVLHHFVRQFGYMLPRTHLHCIVATLKMYWSGSKKFKRMLLDICITRADLMHNAPFAESKEETGNFLLGVGEALDALGEFEKSAALFVEVGEQYVPNTEQEAVAYAYAGVACKRALKFDDSLIHLLKAVKILVGTQKSLNWNEKNANAVITNLVLLHHQVQEVSLMHAFFEKRERQHKAQPDETIYLSLVCLLSKANFLPKKGDDKAYFEQGYSAMRQLKPAYQTSKKATQLLTCLFRDGTVKGYKEGLLSAMPGEMVVHLDSSMFPSGPSDAQTMRKQAERRSRHHLKNGSEEAIKHCQNCHMVEPTDREFMFCRCMIVCYCDKECQRENWKIHKKTCPWFKEQKMKLPGGFITGNFRVLRPYWRNSRNYCRNDFI